MSLVKLRKDQGSNVAPVPSGIGAKHSSEALKILLRFCSFMSAVAMVCFFGAFLFVLNTKFVLSDRGINLI